MTEEVQTDEIQQDSETKPGKLMRLLPWVSVFYALAVTLAVAMQETGDFQPSEDAIMVFGIPAFYFVSIVIGGFYLLQPYKKGRLLCWFGVIGGLMPILWALDGSI